MNISSVTYCQNIALVTLRSVPYESRVIGELLTAISSQGVNVDMISQTAPQGGAISLAFTISMDAMGALLPIINSFKPAYPELGVELTPGMTKLNFYDKDMVTTPGVAAQVFSMLAEKSVQVTMITTSTVDISLLVPAHQEDAALQLCRDTYGMEPQETPFA